MTMHHYVTGKRVELLKHKENLPFYGIVQGLMRLADLDNLELLKGCWPDVYEDMMARYWAPNGVLDDDPLWNGPEWNGTEWVRPSQEKAERQTGTES